MFSSLKIRDFRIYWTGMLISVIGSWIQITAQGWLVYQLTKSAFLLGIVGFVSYLPVFIFSLFGGALADRINKKKLLVITQTSFMITAFLLGFLAQNGVVQTWHIIFIALFNGVIMSFDMPTRQAIIMDIVGKEHLLNAVALNSAAFNGARIVGPALAGVLIASIGSAGCFYINSATFLAVIFALFIINFKQIGKEDARSHILDDIRDALRYVWFNEIARNLILMMSIASLFGLAYTMFMPIFAEEIFHKGAQGLGTLMSANGIGALIGALTLAKLGDFNKKGLLVIISSLVFSIALILFALTGDYWLALVFLVFTGWGGITSMATINTILQLMVPHTLRGRVMGVYMLAFAGFMPLGNFLAGSVSHFLGVQVAVALGGLICVAFFLLIALRKKRIWAI